MKLWISLLAAVAPVLAQEADAKARVKMTKAPTVEVCFVLDTTGSMSALIAGAKRKIWSIANVIVAVKPTPKVRIGLVGYRDRKDDYVTRRTDLTEDLDLVYEELNKFQAHGGGDTPESVNQALHEAVTKMSWTKGDDVLRIVFLVGDAPPHMDYEDDVKYDVSCRTAARNGIVINTIQTGSISGTREVWQKIAKLAEGGYAAIPQNANAVVVRTPMDEELAKLNVRIGKTILAYGSADKKAEVHAKQALAEDSEDDVAADRLAFNARTFRVVQGGGDLIDAIADGKVELAEVEEKDLPEEMREMDAEERAKYVATKREERKKLQAKIDDLLKRRAAYIKAEEAKLHGKGDSFDRQVAALIRKQAAAKGIGE